MKEMRHRARGLRRRRGRMAMALALTVAVGVSGFLTASSVAGNARASATVSVARTELGMVLVNSRGHTLYLFAKDTNGKSACSGSCAKFWPPVIATGKPRVEGGAKASLIGTIKRADGRRQVTYNHHPLYTFVQDTAKGQTHG